MICKSCGAPLRTGEETCRECGKHVEIMDGNGFWDLLGNAPEKNLNAAWSDESENLKTVASFTAVGKKYLPLLVCLALCLAVLLACRAFHQREVRNLRAEFEDQLTQQAEFFREERTALEEECEKLKEENRNLRDRTEEVEGALRNETSNEPEPETEPKADQDAEPEAELVPGEVEI